MMWLPIVLGLVVSQRLGELWLAHGNTKRLVAEAGKRGLVLLSCGVRANVIRFLAPLTATPALIEEGLDLLEQALTAASQG